MTSQQVNTKKIELVVDIPYCHYLGSSMLADIGYPAKSYKAIPAIICAHGGRWIAGGKRFATSGACLSLTQWANYGYFVMNINYRLRDVCPAPACYQDLQCAIRYVHTHAKQYNINEERIFIAGQSAGAHMVSLAATIGDGPWPRTGSWLRARNDCFAAISVAGVYDLHKLNWGVNWIPKGQPYRDKNISVASPIKNVDGRTRPLLLIHGTKDPSAPVAQFGIMLKVLQSSK